MRKSRRISSSHFSPSVLAITSHWSRVRAAKISSEGKMYAISLSRSGFKEGKLLKLRRIRFDWSGFGFDELLLELVVEELLGFLVTVC